MEDYDNFFDTIETMASDEVKRLLIEVEQLVKSLEDSYREAVKHGDRERELRVNQTIMGRPDLSSIDPERHEGINVEEEIEFIVRANLWIREAQGLL